MKGDLLLKTVNKILAIVDEVAADCAECKDADYDRAAVGGSVLEILTEGIEIENNSPVGSRGVIKNRI